MPYGTLLCVSDKPLHGELKLSGMANAFYRERVSQHLRVGLETMRLLREQGVRPPALAKAARLRRAGLPLTMQEQRTTTAGERFLAALGDPAHGPLAFRTTLVVAHPDDETIACGALLRRLPEPTIIHLTDGAPRSLTDAKARGFETAAAYAEARRGELEAAMALAGVAPRQLVALGWSDQEASFHIVEIATELARRLAGTDIVITHAYEGGHADHDTAALAVRRRAEAPASARRMTAPDIIEVPLYRAGPEGRRLAQDFEPWPGAVETAVELSPEEQELKRGDVRARMPRSATCSRGSRSRQSASASRRTMTSLARRMAATFTMSGSTGGWSARAGLSSPGRRWPSSSATSVQAEAAHRHDIRDGDAQTFSEPAPRSRRSRWRAPSGRRRAARGSRDSRARCGRARRRGAGIRRARARPWRAPSARRP